MRLREFTWLTTKILSGLKSLSRELKSLKIAKIDRNLLKITNFRLKTHFFRKISKNKFKNNKNIFFSTTTSGKLDNHAPTGPGGAAGQAPARRRRYKPIDAPPPNKKLHFQKKNRIFRAQFIGGGNTVRNLSMSAVSIIRAILT